MLLLMFLYYLVVFSRPDKDILKQCLLKITVPGMSQVSLCAQGDTWTGPFLGALGRGTGAMSQTRSGAPACSHCFGMK